MIQLFSLGQKKFVFRSRIFMQPTRGLDMHIGFLGGGFFYIIIFVLGFWFFVALLGVGKGGLWGVVCVFFSLVQLCIICHMQ
jgi:hypothetical protein